MARTDSSLLQTTRNIGARVSTPRASVDLSLHANVLGDGRSILFVVSAESHGALNQLKHTAVL